MKKNNLFLLLIILLLVGCVSQRRRLIGSERYEPETTVEPDTTIVPIFDPAVLYVLAREYENTQDTLRSMGEYVEERLIELYPEQAYRGMMSKMADATMSRLQDVRRMPQYRVNTIDGISLSSPNESYFNSVSDSASANSLKFQNTEASASVICIKSTSAESETELK